MDGRTPGRWLNCWPETLESTVESSGPAGVCSRRGVSTSDTSPLALNSLT